MKMLVAYATILLMISMILVILSSYLGNKLINVFQKQTPFECGFDPMGGSRVPFSMRFFLIAIVFLVFDVEIAILLPLLVKSSSGELVVWTILSLSFISVLLGGTLFEWGKGMLDWKK